MRILDSCTEERFGLREGSVSHGELGLDARRLLADRRRRNGGA